MTMLKFEKFKTTLNVSENDWNNKSEKMKGNVCETVPFGALHLQIGDLKHQLQIAIRNSCTNWILQLD